jgi:hypothetical protein
MFIYRKSADRNYRIEEVPPDERYLAEIHIAKHRNGPTGMIKMIFNEQFTSFRNMDTNFANHQGGGDSGSTPTVLKPKSAFQKPKTDEEPQY